MRYPKFNFINCLYRSLCTLIGVQMLIVNSVRAQEGCPFITNFPPISYVSNQFATSPQNWCVGEDMNGRILVANTSGIITYDGIKWGVVRGTENKRMLKFAADKSGQIFTGGSDEIGVLLPNEDGKLEFQSLKEKLGTKHQDFKPIINVVGHEDAVYFRSSSNVFKYADGKFTTWESELGFKKLVSSSAGLFVSEKATWYQFIDGSLHVIASAEETELPQLTGVFRGVGDTLLITTKTHGICKLFNGKIYYSNNLEAKIKVWNACEIGHSAIALATANNGLVTIDKFGNIIDVINESAGLGSNSTWFPYYSNGNLWVGLNSGVALIDYPIGTSFLDKKNGMDLFPMKVSKFGDQLFVGSLEGALWSDEAEDFEITRLIAEESDHAEVIDALQYESQFFMASTQGLVVRNTDNIEQVLNGDYKYGCSAILKSIKYESTIYSAFINAVVAIEIKGDGIFEIGDDISIPHSVYSMAEDAKGNLWAADDGISYISFSTDSGEPKVNTLDSLSGFTTDMGFVQVANINGQLLIGTSIGVYTYDYTTEKLEPYIGFGKRFSDGTTTAFNLTETQSGDVWITTSTSTGILRKQNDNSFIYDSLPILRAPLSGIWDIFEDNDGVIWIAGTEAVVRYDPSVDVNYSHPYKAFIRSVVINDTKEIFGGCYTDKQGNQAATQPDRSIPLLEFRQNSITFKFGAAQYAMDHKLTYSFMLEGKDTSWSSWRTANETNFNNLSEGRYTFRVRSRNVYGNISEEASYSFEILPPWYRTTLAYLLFIVGGIGAIVLIVKLNTKRLKRENEKLEGIITERTAEVREQKERAEQSEAFKQQFLANMSHEIRTPMNAVMGMTNLVLKTPLKPKQKNYLEGIKKSSDNLLHIINDILDLSKIEAGKMELEEIDFSLSDTIETVKRTLEHRAIDKGLELFTTIEPDVNDIVLGDPVRLNQILINLTGNAIKFTDKGSVAIEVTTEDNGIKFSIIDTGVGIPEDKLKTVFESFSQASASDTRKFGGTGLGLSISRQLVDQMGGQISIESEVNHGTIFSFCVDFKKGSNEQLEKRLALERDVDGTILNGLRILVADDNEFNRIVARDTLKSEADVEIIEAENGQEAVDLLLAQEIDIVLMDVQMPVLNGFEATRLIRKMEGPKAKIPIAALTASVLRTDIDRCKQAGMDSYIPKPFKTQDLITGIAELMNIELRTKERKELKTMEKSPVRIDSVENASNLNYLTDFCNGDKMKMKKYIDMFIKAAEKLEPQIITCLKDDDPLTLANLVHGFNTKFTMMGMNDTKSLSVEIENACRAGKGIVDVKEKVDLLTSRINMAVKELSAFDPN